MARRDGCDVVYWAAQRWVDAALRKDDSLFTPGRPIWTLESLNDFRTRVIERPDTAGKGFLEKLERQLAEAPAETIQLAAEALYVHYLIASPQAIRGGTKQRNIGKVLDWSGSNPVIPDDLAEVFDRGILNPGVALNTRLYAQVHLITEFTRNWKGNSDQDYTRLLEDPWSFKQSIQSIDVHGSLMQQEALLHLVFPDAFEPIISKDQKDYIRDSYKTILPAQTSDIDRDLLEIREGLSGQAEQYEDGFDFYSDKVLFVWSPASSAWDRFIGWGSRFVELSSFDKWERNYKLDIANRLEQARLALENGSDDWLTILNQAFKRKNNLVHFITHSKFSIWCSGNKKEAGEALLALWGDESNWSNKIHASVAIGDFLKQVPADSPGGKGTRVNLASFLAMSIDPCVFPVYHTTTFDRGYNLTGFPYPDKSASESRVYEHSLSFLDRILAEAGKRKIELRDRLDAQSMLWSVINWTTEDQPDFPEFEHDALRRFREADTLPASPPPTFEEPIENQTFAQNSLIPTVYLPEASGGSGALTYALTPEPPDGLACDEEARELSGAPTAAHPSATYTWTATDEDGRSAQQTFWMSVAPETLDDLAARLLWDTEHLRNIRRLLEDKRQIVFYGPPGTGKTYVALELAHHFAGAEDATGLVQFHPSYAYEDFVEGFRPADQNGQPGFQLREGPLKRIADKARAQPDATHVLVIDEINRGNVARVFGELYFLLEYRDRKMSLQYSEGRFTLPKNLWFIATMNTADRSIALVDAALRRRFHFVEFSPHAPPVQGLLRRWLEKDNPDLLWVARLVHLANDKLADRHLAIGPSHFMRKDLDENWVELIWNHSIYPYVEEQLFGDQDRLQEFKFESLKRAAQRQDRNPDDDDDTSDTG